MEVVPGNMPQVTHTYKVIHNVFLNWSADFQSLSLEEPSYKTFLTTPNNSTGTSQTYWCWRNRYVLLLLLPQRALQLALTCVHLDSLQAFFQLCSICCSIHFINPNSCKFWSFMDTRILDSAWGWSCQLPATIPLS